MKTLTNKISFHIPGFKYIEGKMLYIYLDDFKAVLNKELEKVGIEAFYAEKAVGYYKGREYPQDGIDFVLLGADLNMDDFNIHSYKNAKTFFEIGNELANWGNLGSVRHYKLNTDRRKAYVVQTVRKEPLDFDPFASIRLLDSDGREAHLNVSTGNEEYDMAVISTVKLN